MRRDDTLRPVFSKRILNYFRWHEKKAVTQNHSEPVTSLKTTLKAMQVIHPGESLCSVLTVLCSRKAPAFANILYLKLQALGAQTIFS